jgi:hypothetical protein
VHRYTLSSVCAQMKRRGGSSPWRRDSWLREGKTRADSTRPSAGRGGRGVGGSLPEAVVMRSSASPASVCSSISISSQYSSEVAHCRTVPSKMAFRQTGVCAVLGSGYQRLSSRMAGAPGARPTESNVGANADLWEARVFLFQMVASHA